MKGLPAQRPGFAAPQTLVEFRGAVERMAPGYAQHPEVTVSERAVAGVHCSVLEPASACGTVVHLHGGGFRIGSPRQVTGFASHVAHRSGMRVVLPRYRLAPEHPFPAALHDVHAVCLALSAGGGVVISGDSAGGNLAAVTAMRLGPQAVSALVLLSPWLDLTLSSASFAGNAGNDRMFSLTAAREAAATYLQGYPHDDPLVSPLMASPTPLPPVLIVVGGVEVLLDDSVRLAAALGHAGKAVEFHCIPEMQHVAVTLDPALPGARQAMEAMTGYLRRQGPAGTGAAAPVIVNR